MDENFRKKIIILFILAIIFAISVLIYFFLIKKPVVVPGTNNNLGNLNMGDSITYKKETKPDNGSNNFYNQENYTETQTANEKQLFKIWEKPTAGFSFVNQTILLTSTTTKLIKGTSTEITIQMKATSSKIYFVDSMSGFVYAYDLKKKNVYQITNTTVPAIHDAYIFNNGENILMRYADDNTIKSLIAKIPTVSEGNSPLALTSISYLPNNISSVSSSLFDKNISYVLPNSNGSTINTLNSKNSISTIYSSLFSEWNIFYGGNNLHITTKPSSYILGTSVNLNNDAIILREKTGLNTLPSKTDNYLLSSFLSSSGIKDFIMSTKTGNVSYLDFQTLSEKCEWGMRDRFILCGVPQTIESGKGDLPDSWYKGFVSFSDNLYIKDLKDNKESLFFNFNYETNEKIDVIKIKLNQEENYLGFINNKDKSFWLLKTDYLTNIDRAVD